MSFFVSFRNILPALNTEQMNRIIDVLLVSIDVVILLLILGTCLINICRKPSPTNIPIKSPESTRAKTSSSKRTRHTVVNNFAAGSVTIYNGVPDRPATSTSQISPSPSTDSSAEIEEQTSDDNSVISSPSPSNRSSSDAIAHIEFRTVDGKSIVKAFPCSEFMSDIFNWLGSTPCPFSGKEGMDFELTHYHHGVSSIFWSVLGGDGTVSYDYARDERARWQDNNIGRLELDGCGILVTFKERKGSF